MKFVISTQEINYIINKCLNVVAQKSAIPVLSNVMVEAKKGEIIVTATDLTVGVRCIAEAKVLLYREETELKRCTTDAFGDFSFDRLPPNSGSYRIEIAHACGSAQRRCELGESLYLGEIGLEAAEANAFAIQT